MSLKTLYIVAALLKRRSCAACWSPGRFGRRSKQEPSIDLAIWSSEGPTAQADRPGCAARCTRTQCSKTAFLVAMEAVIAAVCPACLEYEANFDSQPLFDYTM